MNSEPPVSMVRPLKIDQDVRDGIILEFEVGYLPSKVYRHLKSMGSPVSKAQCYTFYKRWQSTGDLDRTHQRVNGKPRQLGG